MQQIQKNEKKQTFSLRPTDGDSINGTITFNLKTNRILATSRITN